MRPLVLLALAAAATLAAEVPPPAGARVTIRIEGDFRVIESNGLPNHATGRFPSRDNPNPIAPMSHAFRATLRPAVAAAPTPSGHAWFGVALNGVPLEPGTQEFWNDDRASGWTHEAIGGRHDLGIDSSRAHVQPNGAYHYHGWPTGLVAALGGEDGRMLLVGWAADGFPIYGMNGLRDPRDLRSGVRPMRSSYRVKAGDRPSGPSSPGGRHDGDFTQDFEYVEGLGDLDACNGRFGATPEFPAGIYHYHITETFPLISRQWRGTPNPSFKKRGPPPGVTPRKPRRPDDTRGSGG